MNGPQVLWAVAAVLLLLGLRQLSWAAYGVASGLGRAAMRAWQARSPAPAPAGLSADRGGRYRCATGILLRRLDRQSFSGLPLTLLLLSGACIAWYFIGLLAMLRQAAGPLYPDTAMNALVASYRTGPLVAIFIWISEFGSGTTVTVLAAISSAVLLFKRSGHFVAGLWVALAGTAATTFATKILVARPRPQFIDGLVAWSPSFPSSHASGAMACYAFLAYVVVRNSHSQRVRFEVVFWATMLVTAVGSSRVFLSLHYASDVLGGMSVGAFWVIAGILVAEQRHGRRYERDSAWVKPR